MAEFKPNFIKSNGIFECLIHGEMYFPKDAKGSEKMQK